MMGKKYFVIVNSTGDFGIESTFSKVCSVYDIDYKSNRKRDFPQTHGHLTIHLVLPEIKIKDR